MDKAKISKTLKTIGSIVFFALIPFTYKLYVNYFSNSKSINVVSKEGKFKAQFPHAPVKSNKVVESPYGDLKVYFFMYDASNDNEDENLLYAISYFDYPDSVINSDSDKIKGNYTHLHAG